MNNDRIVAWMQLGLTVLFALGFFTVAFIVTLGRAKIDAGMIRIADTLFGGMLTVIAQQSSYWFARQRGAVAEPPPPNGMGPP